MGDIIRFICIVALYHILWRKQILQRQKHDNTITQQRNNQTT